MKFKIGDIISFRITDKNVDILGKEKLSKDVVGIDPSQRPMEFYQALYKDQLNKTDHYIWSEQYRNEMGIKESCKYKEVYRYFKITYDFANDKITSEIVK